MASYFPTNFPNLTGPVIGPDGQISTPWLQFLINLWNRTGGAQGSTYVTSVGLSAPAIFTVTGSPITGSGTLTLTLATEAANAVWAGPTSGAPASPTFRALVAGDLPSTIYGTKSANTIYAGPTSGLAAAPAFRSMVVADLPSTVYGTQSANTFYSGPTTGGAVAPAFRAIVSGDLTSALTTPPAIGATTQSTGAFTTLAATSLTLGAGSALSTYATGSWTPADNSGASLAFTQVSAAYTQIGNLVFLYAYLKYPTTVSGLNASLSGLPVAAAAQNYAFTTGLVDNDGAAVPVYAQVTQGTSHLSFLNINTGAAVTNAQLSGLIINFSLFYPVT